MKEKSEKTMESSDTPTYANILKSPKKTMSSEKNLKSSKNPESERLLNSEDVSTGDFSNDASSCEDVEISEEEKPIAESPNPVFDQLFRFAIDNLIQECLQEAELNGTEPAPLSAADIELIRSITMEVTEETEEKLKVIDEEEKHGIVGEGMSTNLVEEYYDSDDEESDKDILFDIPSEANLRLRDPSLLSSESSIRPKSADSKAPHLLKNKFNYPLFHVDSDFEFSELEPIPSSISSISSETFLANQAEIVKIRVEDRPGNDLRQKQAKKSLDSEAYRTWQKTHRSFPRLRLKRRWPVLEKTSEGAPINLCREDTSKNSDIFTDSTSSSDSDYGFEPLNDFTIPTKMKRLEVLKGRWDQLSKEEIEQEILKNRKAWEQIIVQKSVYPSNILVPFLPRIPGKMDAEKIRWRKSKIVEVKKDSEKSEDLEMNLEERVEKEEEYDEIFHEEPARFCVGSDKPTWSFHLKSYLSYPMKMIEKDTEVQLLPTSDPDDSDTDVSSSRYNFSEDTDSEHSDSEVLDSDDVEQLPKPIVSISDISGIGYCFSAMLVVIVACLAVFGGNGSEMGGVWRWTRNAPFTPLEARLHESATLARVINAINLQNSFLDGNISADSIIHVVLGLGYPDFQKLNILSIDNVQNHASAIKKEMRQVDSTLFDEIEKLKKWKPINTSEIRNVSDSLEVMTKGEIALNKMFDENTAALLGDMENIKTTTKQLGLDPVKIILDKAKLAAENMRNVYSDDIDEWCSLDLTVFSKYIEIEKNHTASMTENSNTLDRVRHGLDNLQDSFQELEKLMVDDSVQMAIDTLESLDLKLSGSEVEEFKKLPEDLKDPWLQKVLNKGKSIEDLESSLNLLLHLFMDINYISQLWNRFNDRKHLDQAKKLLNRLWKAKGFRKTSNSSLKTSFTELQLQEKPDLQSSELHSALKMYKEKKTNICRVLSPMKSMFDKFSEKSTKEELDEIVDVSKHAILDELKSNAKSIQKELSSLKQYKSPMDSAFNKIQKDWVPYQNVLLTSLDTVKNLLDQVQYELEYSKKLIGVLNSGPTRTKRQVDQYEDLRDVIRHISEVSLVMDNMTFGPCPLEGFENSLETSEQLEYSVRVMEAFTNLDLAIKTIQTEGPTAGWAKWENVMKMLQRILIPKFPENPAENLKAHGEVYKVLDSINIPEEVNVTEWREEVSASQGTPESKKALLTALNHLNGLGYAKLRKKDDVMTGTENFFAWFFDRNVEEEHSIPFDPTLLMIILQLLLLAYVIPANLFDRNDTWLRQFLNDLPPRKKQKHQWPKPVPIPVNPKIIDEKVPKPPRDLGNKELEEPPRPPAGHEAPQEGTTKTEVIDGVTYIWDVPPPIPPGYSIPKGEESNLMWVKMKESDEKPNMSYDSDDLRSIEADTLSTQSDFSDLMASTRSEWTVPDFSDSEMENVTDGKEYAEFPKEARMDSNEHWEHIKYAWALKNRLTLQGYRNMTHVEKVQMMEYEAREKMEAKMCDPEEEMRKAEDLKAREQWDKLLEKDIAEVTRRRVNQEEVCRMQMAKQDIEQKLVEQEKAKRTPLENAQKYIEESYLETPEQEITIATIAYESVQKIDNFIQSVHQDHWDHIYRCKSDQYTHDWARVKMTKDDPDDCDFYDACYVFPWQDVFHKVIPLYRNKLIAVSSPIFGATVGVLWHWLYEHDVHFMVMLNQFIEKNLQTCEVWFPRCKGDTLQVRRNAHREYRIKCTGIKGKYGNQGIQRELTITLLMNGQKSGEKRMKLLHMIDWEQDCIPANWQPYVRICERINRESLRHPVAVMSLFGSGRAMALILSLMAAIVARLDDDVSIHAMAHGARASKRRAISCCNQILFWRMIHYDLLFRWFKPLRHLRTKMEERFEVYQDHLIKYKQDFLLLECRLWWSYFESELERYKRMEFMVEYLRNFNEGVRYDLREQRKQQILYDARENNAKEEKRTPYVNGEPRRRKYLREGDKKRDANRPKRKYVERVNFSPQEEQYAKYQIDPVIASSSLPGRYEWVKPSEMKEKLTNGVPVPDGWKYWYTKEHQEGLKLGIKYF